MRLFYGFIFSIFLTSSFSQDKGVGIVYLNDESERKSLDIYSRSDTSSYNLAKFLIEGRNYILESSDLETGNLLEYGYEKKGIPICKVSKDWVEVIFGFDENKKALTGWVKLDKQLGLLLWKTYLKEKLVFFEDPNEIKFYDKIEGQLIDFRLKPSNHLKFDYIMRPQKVDEDWMQVEVVTPSDYCNDPSDTKIKVFWIKFINKEGRPLIWYFTRGC